jgi:hypothetical protein
MGHNSLTYRAGDSEGLATQIMKVLNCPSLVNTLGENGRKMVLEKYSLERMADEIEKYLLNILTKSKVNFLLSFPHLPKFNLHFIYSLPLIRNHMNILFITNFYPPHSVGGYEQWCQEAASYLIPAATMSAY